MEKTKLGIPVLLMAAIVCLLGYFGGYVVTVIAVGYVLLMEENAFLRRQSAKVLALLLAFSLINTVIYLIPDLLNMIQSLIHVFDKYYYSEEIYNNFLNRLANFVSSVVGVAKMVLFLLMSGYALAGKELKIPVFDDLLDKHLNKQEAE